MTMGSIEKKISSLALGMIRSRRKAAEAENGLQCPSSDAIAPAKLRPARFTDFEGVAQLKQRWHLHADSPENWERLWRQNPALASHGIERPIGWVLEADGVIVGYLGNISLLYRYGSRTLTAVTAHGLVVDTPYRAIGVTLVAAYFHQKSVDLFVSTSAIEAVGKIAVAFKSAPVPQPDYDTALFWVLRPHSFARVLMHKLQTSPALRQIGAVIGATAIGADKLIRRRWPNNVPKNLSVSTINVDQIDEAFETLWIEKQQEGNRLLADRTPAALRWHFEIPGDRGSARVLSCRRKQELVGYAIVRNDTKAENGLRSSIIADMIAKNDDPEIIKALLSAAYNYAKDSGSDILEMLGFPLAIRNVASEWNPYRRKYSACPFYYKAADPALHQELANGVVWYASPFDGDATLIRPSYSTPVVTNTGIETKVTPKRVAFDILKHEHSEVL